MPKQQENSRIFWEKIEGKLSFFMRTAANLAFQKGFINNFTRNKYFASSMFRINK